MKSPQTNRSTRPGGQDRISMTPMIDIVFLLIIFFLVSSHLSRQENRRPVSLAMASSGALPGTDAGLLTLTVEASGDVFFGSDKISTASLRDHLTSYLRSQGDAANRRATTVRLRIDRTLPYGQIEPILKELARQGVADVAIVINPSS